MTNTEFPLTEVEFMPESGQRFQQMLALLPIALYTCDTQGRILDYNVAAEALWGGRPDEKVRWSPVALFYSDGSLMPPETSPMARAFEQSDSSVPSELLIESPVSGKRWMRVTPGLMLNDQGQPEIATFLLQDLTEEKKNEKIAEERLRSLREANTQLEESNRDLEQFAFIASHDLQEPLRKIQAFGDLLKSRLAGENNADVRDLINRMQSASSRMKTLIDSLLSFSRLSFNNNPPELVNLNKVLDAVLADLETSVKDSKAEIELNNLYPVMGEPLQLRQLFQNLIANALKFSRKGETPRITIQARLVTGETSGITVSQEDLPRSFQLIEVQDNGIGFEEEYAHKIFQLFQRLHGKTEYPGSGVGLSIVQKVVNNHAGYISAHGEPGAGANFRILLPYPS